MLDEGIIRPSTSPFSSLVLLLKKRTAHGASAQIIELECYTFLDRFLIPIVDELLDELFSAQLFSKLDFRADYHQIWVRSEDTHKTAFQTHNDHYEYLVMLFGLTNALSTF